MSVEFKMKLVKVGNSLRVTIPLEICDALGLNAGDTLGLSLVDNGVRVRKIK